MYRDMAELLHAELRRRRLSQQAFAKLIGTTPANVSNTLTGKRRLSDKEARRWLAALGLRLCYAAEADDEVPFFADEHDVWTWLLKRLSRSRRPAPARSEDDLSALLREAGWTARCRRRLLPHHLSPLIDSGWLWQQGSVTRAALAAQLEASLHDGSP